MKILCIVQEKLGGPEELKVGDRELGALGENEVRIKIEYTAVNRADLMQRMGKYPNQKQPMNLGLECAGIIDEIGSNCCVSFQEGDRVMSLLTGGGYSAFAQVDCRFCMKVPDSMTLAVAAGIPEVFLTAYQLLFWVGELNSEKCVLVHGGGSGVGTSAIQLAKLNKNKVLVTAGSQNKIERAIELKADLAVNYKETNFNESLKGHPADLILDCVGESYWKMNADMLARDGIWVLFGLLGGMNINGPLLGLLLSKRGQIRASTLMSRSNEYKAKLISEFWTKYSSHFVSGEIKPIIDCTFDLSDVAAAHQYVAENKNCGKVLLKMNL